MSCLAQFDCGQHVLIPSSTCLVFWLHNFIGMSSLSSSQCFNWCTYSAIVGDITPSDGIPKAEKSRREQAALNEMCEVLGGGMRGMRKLVFLLFFALLGFSELRLSGYELLVQLNY